MLLAAVLSPALSEDHAALLARLKVSDPDNPLPSWLAAAQQIAAGNSGAAFAELLGAEGRNAFDNHQLALVDERRAMYEAAGFDPLRAEIEALFGLPINYLAPLQVANKAVIDALHELRSRGESDLAQDLTVTALNLGRSMSGERILLIDQIFGLSLEKSALSSMGESAGEILGGAANASRLAEIDQRKKEIREVANDNSLLESASHEQFVEYLRRMRADGEMSALRWLAAERAPR